MGSFLNILIMLLTFGFKLIGPITEAVQAYEEAVPEAGKGTEKLNNILAIAKGIAGEAAKETGSTISEATLGSVIKIIVDSVVGIFNSTGVFKK